jgi:hypothetical protein
MKILIAKYQVSIEMHFTFLMKQKRVYAQRKSRIFILNFSGVKFSLISYPT